MSERIFSEGLIDFTGPLAIFIGPEGNAWRWKVYDGPNTRTGLEADEYRARLRARHAAGVTVRPPAPRAQPGAFAQHHATTRSSRKGEIPSRPTYLRQVESRDLHLCLHGQKQVRCTSCSTWHCACPGSLPHPCTIGETTT